MNRRMGFIAIVLLLAACGGGATTGGGKKEEKEPSPTESTLASGEKAAFKGVKDATGKAELEVELDDFYFEPTIITGSAGQKLTIKAHNEGSAIHSLTIGGQDVVDLPAGQEGSGTVTFPASGAVTFVCKYHTAQNMRGELAVR
ncbi:MAG: cupredoxin domain-containing protein [Actinomycetota bacterium]